MTVTWYIILKFKYIFFFFFFWTLINNNVRAKNPDLQNDAFGVDSLLLKLGKLQSMITDYMMKTVVSNVNQVF